MKLPKRWLTFSKSSRIKNTPFVACKTPLRSDYSTVLSPKSSFTPNDLLLAHPKIKLVIDLTNTNKYYCAKNEFQKNGVEYVKIASRGHGVVPNESQFNLFVESVNEFFRLHPKDNLIAVHCTHGVNRTGYFIIRFMVEMMGYDCEAALQEFLQSRGHAIERTNLIKDLFQRYCQNESYKNEVQTVLLREEQ